MSSNSCSSYGFESPTRPMSNLRSCTRQMSVKYGVFLSTRPMSEVFLLDKCLQSNIESFRLLD